MIETSTTANAMHCDDCGKIIPYGMTHHCTATAGAQSGSGWLDGIGTVRACLDCGVLVAGGVTRCLACAQKVRPKFNVEYADDDVPPPPVWAAIRDIPPGAMFETEEGTQAVKSEYLLQPDDPASYALCVIIGSGEFFHGQYGDDTVVCRIG
jgi:hypothetical protein